MGHVNALKAKWTERKADRAHARTLSRMAAGDWIDDLPTMPHEPNWHATKGYRAPFAPNVLGTALRQLTYLYDEEPQRTIPDQATHDWAEGKLWGYGLGLTLAMSTADSLARLQGTALLLPVYKTSPDAARDFRAGLLGDLDEPVDTTDDGVECVVVRRENFEFLATELDPRHVEAGVVLIGMTAGEGAGKQPVHHYYDRQHFARLVGFKPQPIGPNGELFVEHGMPDHPLVPVRNSEAESRLYAEGFGGPDVIDNTKAVGGIWREYGWSSKLQRGQPYVIGAQLENKILAPDAFIEIPEGSQFGIASNAANLDGMRDAATSHLELLARSLGLPPRAFRLEQGTGSTVGMSGIAIAMDRAELEDDRRSRVKLATYWEGAIHRKASMVYTAATGTDLDTSGLVVRFVPLPALLSFDQRMAQLSFERREGLIGDLDTLRQLYPGHTDEELQARLDRAREDIERRIEAEAERAGEVAGAEAEAVADVDTD
jgi:hypothetical protein